MIVVGTRIHWSNHETTKSISVEPILTQIKEFCRQASLYSEAAILALGVPFDVDSGSNVRNQSIQNVAHHLHEEMHKLQLNGDSYPVRIVPMSYWGAFVPALNAIVAYAATEFPQANKLLLQSLELKVDARGVHDLLTHFDFSKDLVVGAAVPGHDFQPNQTQPLVLNGLTTPWNTLALWNLPLLAKIGFPLIGEGLFIEGSNAAGVEEVSTISLFQKLFPDVTIAKVVSVTGLEWHTIYEDAERVKWQAVKMKSKLERPAKQMHHFGITPGQVYHLNT